MQSRVFGGSLRWVGEHWVCALQGDGAEETARISLYNTHESEAGEGVVAYVSIRTGPGAPLSGVFTDNRELAAWVHETWGGGSGGRFDQPLTVRDARLVRGERCQDERSWSIQSADTRLQVVWRRFEEPVVSYRGDRPEVYAQRSLFNVLLFACEAEVRLNGARIDGVPYPHDRWRPVIGGERSSCVVALAETFITPP